MEKDMEKVALHGTMDNSLKEIGKMGKKMVLESGSLQKVITMKVNGPTTDKTAKDSSSILEVPSIKAISKIS